jgi:hypothetical protein
MAERPRYRGPFNGKVSAFTLRRAAANDNRNARPDRLWMFFVAAVGAASIAAYLAA